MTKTFKNISDVKSYVREFNNSDRYDIRITGEIPADDDIIEIKYSEREGIRYDFEYIDIAYKDFVGNMKTTEIRISKCVGCML